MNNYHGFSRQLLTTGVIAALLTACGGGGGSSNDAPPQQAADTQAPTAKIYFPTDQALTTADSITVTGTATDAQNSPITSVTVNGEAATSDNDFANWRAVVPLTAGSNAITVETADSQGNSEASAANITIKNEVALLNPNDISLSSAGDRIFLVDEVLRAVVAVDTTSGQRSVISDTERGTGAVLNAPGTITQDGATDRVLVGDGTQIIAVDLATGNRSLFADLGTGNQAIDLTLDTNGARVLVVTTDNVLAVPTTGGSVTELSTGVTLPFNSPGSIVVDSAGDRALVVDSGDASVIAVDLASGARSVLASANVGNGVDLATPLGITLNNAASSALVTDLGSPTVAPRIVAIELTTGTRTVVSSGGSASIGSGQEFSFPVAVVANSSSILVIDPALASILSVNETNGNRGVVSSGRVGDGIEFNGPFSIGYDVSNDRALVTDNVTNAIYTVDLDNGARTLLSGGGSGTGTEFVSLFNLAIGETQAYVTDTDTASVLAVDLGSGNRTVLSSNIGASPNKSPLGIALDSSTNTLYLSVIENDTNIPPAVVGSELFSLPVNSSAATPFALSGTNFTSLTFAQNLIIDSEGGSAYVADTAADSLFAVTISGGDTRSLGAIANSSPTGIAPFQDVTLMGDQAVLVDSSLASLISIDTSSATRSIISSDAIGNGTALQDPIGITYAANRTVLLVVDRLSFAVFAVEPSSGDRVIISR